MRFVVLLTLVALASAAPEKRFWRDTIDNITHWFTNTWNNAKAEFEQLTSGIHINFDQVVDTLIPLIDSDMTEGACGTACVAAATTVLGPAAPLAGTVCAPVCKAALAKLEETAG